MRAVFLSPQPDFVFEKSHSEQLSVRVGRGSGSAASTELPVSAALSQQHRAVLPGHAEHPAAPTQGCGGWDARQSPGSGTWGSAWLWDGWMDGWSSPAQHLEELSPSCCSQGSRRAGAQQGAPLAVGMGDTKGASAQPFGAAGGFGTGLELRI